MMHVYILHIYILLNRTWYALFYWCQVAGRNRRDISTPSHAIIQHWIDCWETMCNILVYHIYIFSVYCGCTCMLYTPTWCTHWKYIYTHARTHICTHAHMHTHTHTRTHARTHARTHTHKAFVFTRRYILLFCHLSFMHTQSVARASTHQPSA